MQTALAAVFFIALSVESRAEIIVKQYQEMMASGVADQISLAKIYVTGIGEGIVEANGWAHVNKTPLFCQPPKFALGISNFVNILDGTIKRISTVMPKNKLNRTSIAPLLFQGLLETFPCAAKRVVPWWESRYGVQYDGAWYFPRPRKDLL